MSKQVKPSKPYEFKEVDGCFICTSHTLTEKGYPRVGRNGKMKKLSHVIYEECFGLLEPGQIILHKCDKPACINPEHLVAGTQLENMKDKVRKKRQATGEKQGHSKLKEKDVIEIRRMREEGFKLREIAEKFNVSIYCIHLICKRKNWKHI